MDKEQMEIILTIAQQQLDNLSDEDKGAEYYLLEIVEDAKILLYSGY